MAQYLLSTFEVEGEVPGAPQTPEEMKAFMGRVVALEDEMEATGTFVFGGELHSPDASTVLRTGDRDVVMTDGPFVEANEHIADHTCHFETVFHHLERRTMVPSA